MPLRAAAVPAPPGGSAGRAGPGRPRTQPRDHARRGGGAPHPGRGGAGGSGAPRCPRRGENEGRRRRPRAGAEGERRGGGAAGPPPRGAGAGAWRSCGRGAAPRGFPRKVGRWARPAAPPVLGGGPPTGRASHRALRAEGKVSGAAAAACGEPRRDGPVPRSVMRCTRPFRNESERARSHGLIFPVKSVEP